MNENMSLAYAPTGRPLESVSVLGGRGIRARLADMGLGIGSEVRLISVGRGGGPVLVTIGESRLAIGHGMAGKIMVREKF